MTSKVSFSFCMLFKRSFWRNFDLRRLFKPIEPGLHLSEKALDAPLPPGPLSDLRDFLARRDSWQNHPIDSVEAFMAIPAVGVSVEQPVPSVIGIDKPVFTSLGFGMEGIQDAVANYTNGVCDRLEAETNCGNYLCITHVSRVGGRKPDLPPGELAATTCYDSFCGANDCFNNTCKSQKCADHWCDVHSCSDHACGKQSSIAIATQLADSWDHPFVKELAQYFGVNLQEELATAVKAYVGRNLYSQSSR
jgi:hypothetical protein